MSRLHDTQVALAVAVQAGGNVLLWGEPGIGKTSGVIALADELGWHNEVVIGSIRDATDVGGLPLRTEAGVVLAPPAWAVRIVEQEGRGRRSVLFLDELTTSPPSVQAAMLRVVMDRVVGERPLPHGTAVVAAANPPDLAADGYDLAPPLANRFCHLDWPVDPRAWCEGLIAGWGPMSVPRLPDGWEGRISRWRARVAGFITHRSPLLHALPGNPDAQGRAWPSPRSWESAARLMAAAEAADPGGTALLELLTGCVGEGAAGEFLTWLDAADLPDPEAVLADPGLLDLPQRGDRLLAVLGGVVGAVRSAPDVGRWDAAWQILDRVAAGGQPDVAAVAARSLLEVRRDGWLLPSSIEVFSPILRAAGAMA